MDAAGTGTAAETARDTDEDEDRAGDDAAATPDGAAAEDKAAGDSAPPWTIASWRAGPGPAAEKLAAEADEDAAPADEGATSADEDATEDAAAAPEADKKPNPAEGWLAAGPAPAAGAGARTGKPAQPAEAGPAAPGSAKQAAKPQAASQVEVTVVPGVARYHRNGCILIRFLGTDDLEVMPRPQAQDAGFAACRACQPDELPTG
jgi:hypothetical protein